MLWPWHLDHHGNVTCLLLLDSCPAHANLDKNKLPSKLVILFFPPNCTSLLQPADMGMIACLKVGYKANMLRRLLANCNDDSLYQEALDAGQSQVTFNRMYALNRGDSQISSAVKSSQLVFEVATNSSNKIAPASIDLGGSGEANKKKFKIVVQGSKFDTRRRVSTSTYLVAGDNMTSQIQRINRTSGKIVSITEVV